MQVVVERQRGHRLEVRTATASAIVDRPAAQAGEPGAFRSVELLVAGLGACMIGTMLSSAERDDIPVEDVRLELKPLTTVDGDRVAKVRMTMHVGGDLSDEQLERLHDAAASCKVHNTLHAGVRTMLTVERATSPAPGSP